MGSQGGSLRASQHGAMCHNSWFEILAALQQVIATTQCSRFTLPVPAGGWQHNAPSSTATSPARIAGPKIVLAERAAAAVAAVAVG